MSNLGSMTNAPIGGLKTSAMGSTQQGTQTTGAMGTSGSSGMSNLATGDIISLIIADHRQVDRFYEEFKASNDNARKVELGHWIIKELSMHAALEEMILYPFISQKMSGGKAKADHSMHEHGEMKKLLSKLDGLDFNKNTMEFNSTLDQVMTAVKHHVQEEENDILPQLRSVCTNSELMAKAEEWTSKKKIAPTHPHPMMHGVTGMAATALNAMTMPLDALRDKISGERHSTTTTTNMASSQFGTQPSGKESTPASTMTTGVSKPAMK